MDKAMCLIGTFLPLSAIWVKSFRLMANFGKPVQLWLILPYRKTARIALSFPKARIREKYESFNKLNNKET